MREARIILPVNGNDGLSVEGAHKYLKMSLASEFGGFSAIKADGGWVDNDGALQEEPVVIYDVAAPSGVLEDKLLHDIARVAGREAGQICVYVKDFSGNVELIKINHFFAVA